jgi:uncharacterized membrane protein YgaE (UPF0421/DUF939 family)
MSAALTLLISHVRSLEEAVVAIVSAVLGMSV